MAKVVFDRRRFLIGSAVTSVVGAKASAGRHDGELGAPPQTISDSEIADVSTYIRNSWGNEASAVSTSQVSDMRRKLGLEDLRLTPNSGDRK